MMFNVLKLFISIIYIAQILRLNMRRVKLFFEDNRVDSVNHFIYL